MDNSATVGNKQRIVLLRQRLPHGLQYAAIALLLLGIFFRFYNLDRKVYWTDEALTSLRMTGHTKTEFVEQVFTGEVITAATIQQYQRPNGKGWGDTLNALEGNAEQAPLYFLLARLWGEGFGYSVTAVRGFSALISLLSFPCLFWLCWELFQSAIVGWTALGLFAITPVHILYAQDARPYSLWTVCILLSSAALLWALRTQTRRSWAVYAASLALGLYTQLLFGAVAIAHGIYVFGRVFGRNIANKNIARPNQSTETRRLSKPLFSDLRPYLLAVGAALLAFSPWLVLLLTRFDRLRSVGNALTEAHPFLELFDDWSVELNRSLLNQDFGSANLILVLLVFYALYIVCRNTRRNVWLFVLTLIGLPFLLLALPDVLLGGERSLRVRYLFPSYLGIQIALAYLFATQIFATQGEIKSGQKNWQRTLWQLFLISFITISIFACAVGSQAQVWWNKGISRCAYYPPVSGLINRMEQPLVVGDGRPSEILALSYWLAPKVRLQLVSRPKQLQIAAGFKTIVLINPSKPLRSLLTRRGYQVTLIYKDPDAEADDAERLWRVQKL